MPQHALGGRSGFIRPTETQLRTNTIVVPRAFIDNQRRSLRWFHGFDVVIGDSRIPARKLDLENRIGGIPLRSQFALGDMLKLEVVNDKTLRIRKADDGELKHGLGVARPADASSVNSP